MGHLQIKLTSCLVKFKNSLKKPPRNKHIKNNLNFSTSSPYNFKKAYKASRVIPCKDKIAHLHNLLKRYPKLISQMMRIYHIFSTVQDIF